MTQPDPSVMSTTPLKRTPLHAAHVAAGARLIDFGGWDMPVQYSSIVDEHLCVRKASGIFDISHMGEVRVTGPGAAGFLNRMLTHDVRRLEVGQAQYSLMCLPEGGTVDDLYVYRLETDAYLLIINASRIDVDQAWLARHAREWGGQVRGGESGMEVRGGDGATPAPFTLHLESDDWGAVAVQGPRTVQFMETVFPGPSLGGRSVSGVLALARNEVGQWGFEGQPVWVARTGYTGEDGFECVAAPGVLPGLWQRMLAAGHVGCLQPCGLGARDTLRTEMGYPLYGHELDERRSPVAAGLTAFVKWDKGEFMGREALWSQKEAGTAEKCIAFRMVGKAPPPRPGYAVELEGAVVGEVVSGTQSPSLGCGIGMAYVRADLATPGRSVSIRVRGQAFPAELARRPLIVRA